MNTRLISATLVLVLLAACDSGEKKKEAQQYHQPARNTISVKPAQSPEKLNKADRILAYYNHVHAMLEKGTLADMVHRNTSFYAEHWLLPVRQKSIRPKNLAAPAGLFSQQDAQELATALDGMDHALNTMLGHYAELEKYVLDRNIQDDGKQGKIFVDKINAAHEQYLGARASWLGLLDKQARIAENILLQEHPLQRQILAAQKIFTQFREVSTLIASGESPLDLLGACRESIQNDYDKATAPPFLANPQIERLYRNFLRTVLNYMRILDRAIREGLHEPQKREINLAQDECRRAYNEFAREVR